MPIRACGLVNLVSKRPQLAWMPAAVRVAVPSRFGGGRPERSEFEARALNLLKGFDKIDQGKLSVDAHFTKDLGLDSLDTVEVLMAVEDEFAIEIPDNDADNMHSLRQAIDYIYERWTPQHHW